MMPSPNKNESASSNVNNTDCAPNQEFFRKFAYDARLVIYGLECGRDDIIPTKQELVRFSLKRIYQDTAGLSHDASIEAGRRAIYKYLTSQQSQYTDEEKKFMDWLVKRIESDTPPFFQDVKVLINKFWQKIRRVFKKDSTQ